MGDKEHIKRTENDIPLSPIRTYFRQLPFEDINAIGVWHEYLPQLEEAMLLAASEDHADYVTQLIRGIFEDTPGSDHPMCLITIAIMLNKNTDENPPPSNHPQAIAFREAFYRYKDFVKGIAKLACSLDKNKAHEAVLPYLEKNDLVSENISQLILSTQEMQTEYIIVQDEEQTMYFNRKLPFTLPNGYKIREAKPGKFLFIEDEQGKGIKIVALKAIAAENQNIEWDVESEIDLDEDITFEQAHVMLSEADKEAQKIKASNIESFLHKLVVVIEDDFVTVHKLLEPADQQALSEITQHTTEWQRMEETRKTMIESMLWIQETIQQLTQEDQLHEAAVIKMNFSLLLQELLNLIKTHKPWLPQHDIYTGLSSFFTLRRTIEAGLALQKGEPIPFVAEKTTLSVPIIHMATDFYGAYFQAPTIAQNTLDHGIAANIAIQQEAHYAGQIERHKQHFYTEYTSMNQDSVTTSTLIDVARAKTAIDAFNQDRLSQAESEKRKRFGFFGSGDCSRAEHQFVQHALSLGIPIEEFVAIDLVDYSQSPAIQQHGIRFQAGSFLDRRLHGDNKYDFITFPWSVMNDIIEKQKLIQLFNLLADITTRDGYIYSDGPALLGKNSYLEAAKRHTRNYKVFGVVEHQFEREGKPPLSTLFNIIPLEELIMHGLRAGLLPVNVPLSSRDRAELYYEIEDNEEILSERREKGADQNAIKHFLWQSKTNGKCFNRASIVWKNVGDEEIYRQTRLPPSVLLTLGKRAFES